MIIATAKRKNASSLINALKNGQLKSFLIDIDFYFDENKTWPDVHRCVKH
jgi:hypothetical protein